MDWRPLAQSYEQQNTALRRDLDEALEALKCLRNEVKGALGMERPALVELLSLTNVRCLEFRLSEADLVLSKHSK